MVKYVSLLDMDIYLIDVWFRLRPDNFGNLVRSRLVIGQFYRLRLSKVSNA